MGWNGSKSRSRIKDRSRLTITKISKQALISNGLAYDLLIKALRYSGINILVQI